MVAGKSSPERRWCTHSKEWDPWRKAVSSISLALSAEAQPSGCRSGEYCHGPRDTKSVSSGTPNIAIAAGLPEVKRHEGGSIVMRASRDFSNSIRNRVSLAPRAASMRLRSVMSRSTDTPMVFEPTCISLTEHSKSRIVPSLHRCLVSNAAPFPERTSCRLASITPDESEASGITSMKDTGWPINSSRSYPRSLKVALLAPTITGMLSGLISS